MPLLLSLVIEHDAPTKALRILEEHPEAWKPEERRMLQTALLVKCGRRAEALELLRKAGDGGAGKGRERMAVELALAEEDWTGARKGAMSKSFPKIGTIGAYAVCRAAAAGRR